MYVYVCICMFVYVCTCMYVYVCTNVCMQSSVAGSFQKLLEHRECAFLRQTNQSGTELSMRKSVHPQIERFLMNRNLGVLSMLHPISASAELCSLSTPTHTHHSTHTAHTHTHSTAHTCICSQ